MWQESEATERESSSLSSANWSAYIQAWRLNLKAQVSPPALQASCQLRILELVGVWCQEPVCQLKYLLGFQNILGLLTLGGGYPPPPAAIILKDITQYREGF